MMSMYIETIEIELDGSTEISRSAPETDMIVDWEAPPQTLMIAGVGVIASMCKRYTQSKAQSSARLARALPKKARSLRRRVRVVR